MPKRGRDKEVSGVVHDENKPVQTSPDLASQTELRRRIESVVAHSKTKLIERGTSRSNELGQLLLCASCSEVLLDPCTSSCGDSFCQHCYKEVIQGLRTCPSCYESVKPIPTPAVTLRLQEVLQKVAPQELERRLQVASLRDQGLNALCSQDYQAAISLLTSSLGLERSALVLCHRSLAFLQSGRIPESLKDAEDALLLSDMCPVAFLRRGQALCASERHQEAFGFFVQYAAFLDSRDALKDSIDCAARLLEGEPSLDLQALASRCPAFAVPPERREESHDRSRSDRMVLSNVTQEDLECSLCYNLLHEPVATKCGHVFCSGCLERSLDHGKLCPICRDDISDMMGQLNVCRVLDRLIAHQFPEYQERCDSIRRMIDEQRKELPIFVCNIAYPGVSCPLHIFEPRYRLMMQRCIESGNRRFGMCVHTEAGASEYGTVLRIQSREQFPDGRSNITTIGVTRFRILRKWTKDGYLVAEVEWVEDRPEDPTKIAPSERSEQELMDDIRAFVDGWMQKMDVKHRREFELYYGRPPKDPGIFSFWVLNVLPIIDDVKYSLLQRHSARERLLEIKTILDSLPRAEDDSARRESSGCCLQ